MTEEKKYIEGIWKQVEQKEQNMEILRGLERKQESHLTFGARELLSALGLRGIFMGMMDVLAVSMAISVCIFAGIYLYLGVDCQDIYGMIFIFSPTLYACIFSLSYLKEMQMNTFLVQMSCRYTFFHILVFRMMLNSGMAILFNFIYICTLNSRFELSFVKAVALSFSSLMLFSLLLIKSLESRRIVWHIVGISTCWFLGNLLLLRGMRELYLKWIEEVPLSILGITACFLAFFYLRELKKMLRVRDRRRYLYA